MFFSIFKNNYTKFIFCQTCEKVFNWYFFPKVGKLFYYRLCRDINRVGNSITAIFYVTFSDRSVIILGENAPFCLVKVKPLYIFFILHTVFFNYSEKGFFITNTLIPPLYYAMP